MVESYSNGRRRAIMSNSNINFLNPDLIHIRHSINGIIDSYNNPWDILAELIQNSVDAIRQSPISEKGKIELFIDCVKKEIEIKDNGIGIDPDELPDLLKPFSTNKKNISNVVGEKGVGLKYVIFSSNYFQIKSGTTSGSSTGTIIGARGWKDSLNNESLLLEYQNSENPGKGTHVKISDVLNDTLFELTLKQLEFTLRTCTAIGNTISAWHHDIEIEVKLHHIDVNGNAKNDIDVPFKYYFLPEEIDSNSSINLQDFINWDSADTRTDSERRLKLHDKIIFKKGSYLHGNNRTLDYYAFYIPSRGLWNRLSVSRNLATPEQIDDYDWNSKYYFTTLSNGIYLSTKGMPTGITIDHPTTGWAGYWGNFFILFNDDFLKFDIGRKTIHGRQSSIHKDYARKVFNDFLKYITKFVSGDIDDYEPTDWDRDEIFSEIDQLININRTWLKFQKVPTSQEASVAAIFYECIGNGRIKGITPLISGYKNKYDLYAKWGSKKVVIEFKSKLSNILKDFTDMKKLFDEINCIVCWDVTSIESQKLYDMQITLNKVQNNSLSGRPPTKFPHSTHTMQLSGFTSPIFVIDLKLFIENEDD